MDSVRAGGSSGAIAYGGSSHGDEGAAQKEILKFKAAKYRMECSGVRRRSFGNEGRVLLEGSPALLKPTKQHCCYSPRHARRVRGEFDKAACPAVFS